jgi:hypothetical protein
MTMPTDEELLRRAITNARPHKSWDKQPRWAVVMELLAVGSTHAEQLCTRFGVDPDEQVRR